MSQPRPTFAQTLRQRRRDRGLTLDAVAKRIGCAKSYLSMIERGDRGAPAADLIVQIERVLGFDEGYLLALGRPCCPRCGQEIVAAGSGAAA